jgi:hypothetical protein
VLGSSATIPVPDKPRSVVSMAVSHPRLTVHSNTRREVLITLVASDDEGEVVVGINKHVWLLCVCLCVLCGVWVDKGDKWWWARAKET